MNDLVKRLRIIGDAMSWQRTNTAQAKSAAPQILEAADEIERLQKHTEQQGTTNLMLLEQLATVTRERDDAQEELRLAQQDYIACQKDAGRYRWLREQVSHKTFIPIAQCVWKRNSDPHAAWVNLIDAEDMDTHIDAAIDAAMKEQTT